MRSIKEWFSDKVKVGKRKLNEDVNQQWSPLRMKLGPMLFIIYINALEQVTLESLLMTQNLND